MTDEQRQEIMRRMNEGMCAMSDAQMAVRAAEQADGMRNAWPDGIDYAKGQVRALVGGSHIVCSVTTFFC